MEGFEAILAAGNMGVVVQMAESCAQWEDRQSVLLQRLLQVRMNYGTDLLTVMNRFLDLVPHFQISPFMQCVMENVKAED